MSSRLDLIRKLHELDAKFAFSVERELYEFSRSEILVHHLNYPQDSSFQKKNIDFNRIQRIITNILVDGTRFLKVLLSKRESQLLMEHPRRFSGEVVKFEHEAKAITWIYSNLLAIKSKPDDNTVSIDIVLVAIKIIALFAMMFVTVHDKELVKLGKRFNLKYNKAYMLIGAFVFRAVLWKMRFREVRVYVSYAKPNICLIKAAKSLNISTTEYQHGIVDTLHPYYSFGYPASKVVYCCDRFISYEKKSITNKRLIHDVSRYEYVEPEHSPKEKATKKKFLIVGQSNVELNMIFLSVAKSLNLNLVFRPHPNDTNDYSEFKYFISQVQDSTSDIERSEVVIGINSTMLVQALNLGVKVISVDYPGHEYLLGYMDRIDLLRIYNCIDEERRKKIIACLCNY